VQMTVQSNENKQVQALPIDFALVTVCPFVLDSILQHIDGYKIVQDDSVPLTYYQGYINTPATDEHYEVVVCMLRERDRQGDETNEEIVANFTLLIKRWHPAYVLTIGMADGVTGKVKLGDIVIADFVYDYQPTKQISGDELQMSQQFPSDRLLYGRAFSYQSNEWQNTITLPWLTAPQNGNLSSQELANRGDITLPWPTAPQNSNLSSQELANRSDITLPWPTAPQDGNLTPQEHTNRGDITLPWPTALQTKDTLPKEHFGTIISGKNMVSNARVLSQLQDECPTLLALARDSAAIARACTQQPYPVPFLEIRDICNYTNEQNNNYQIVAAEIASAFAIGFLRSRPIPPLTRHIYQIKEQKPLLILCAQSLRPITRYEITSSLGKEAISRPIEIVYLDFTDLEANWVMAHPEVAVQRIIDPQGPLQKALMRRKEVDFAFYGLMRIPLAFLIGHLIPSFQPVRLFDIHPHPDPTLETWIWPGTGEPFPPLEVRGIPRRKNVAKRVVAISISISFTIAPRQIRTIGLHDALIVELKVPYPKRGIVRSEEQVRKYGCIFHNVLDLLIEQCPAIKCIHVFYAGPMALAFHMAQQIAGDVHPPVVAWNFLPPRYDWGIDLTTASFGNPCIIRPLGPALPSKKTDEYYRYFGD
jgi:nucleoside phosphorylase